MQDLPKRIECRKEDVSLSRIIQRAAALPPSALLVCFIWIWLIIDFAAHREVLGRLSGDCEFEVLCWKDAECALHSRLLVRIG